MKIIQDVASNSEVTHEESESPVYIRARVNFSVNNNHHVIPLNSSTSPQSSPSNRAKVRLQKKRKTKDSNWMDPKYTRKKMSEFEQFL